MAEHPEPAPEVQRPGQGEQTLGGILAEARRERGLTIEQLAAKLRVEAGLLEALEADRFEALPAPVFVKGYLRHLANRFDLEYGDLLRRYTGQTETKDARVTYDEPIREESKFLAPLLIGALVLALGIPAIWLTWGGRALFTDFVSSEEEAPEPPPAQVEPAPDEVATSPDPGVTTAPEPIVQPSTVAPDPVESVIGEPLQGDVSAPGDVPANEPGEEDVSAPGDVPATEPGAEDAPATEPDNAN